MPTPSKTRLEPLWKPLGVQDGKYGPRYWFDIGGHRRAYRPVDMHTVDFLTSIYPDLEYWRRQFPWGFGRKIDKSRALKFFIQSCRDVGPYNPPAA